MAQTLKQLIQNYTKDAPISDETLQSFVEYAYGYTAQMVAKFAPHDITLFLTNVEATANTTSLADCILLYSVFRDGKMCEIISPQANALMFGLYAPDKYYPKAYMDVNIVKGNPAPSSSEKLSINYIKHPTLTDVNTDVAIDGCPTRYIPIVIKKAAIETIIHLLSLEEVNYDIILPVAPSAIELSFEDKELPVFVAPTPIESETLDASIFDGVTIELPEPPTLPVLNLPIDIYTDGGSSITGIPDTLEINAVLNLPDTPDDIDYGTELDSIIKEFDVSNVPDIVLPVLDLSSITLSITPLELEATEPTADVIDLDASLIVFGQTQPSYSHTFDDLATEIAGVQDLIGATSEDEDIELATVHLQDISQKLNLQQQSIQDSLNTFNASNVAYQAELQKAINDANNSSNVAVQKQSSKLQKFSNEVQKYQIQVNKEVTAWQQDEVQTKVLTYSTERANALQAYQVDINAAIQNTSTMIQQEAQRVSGSIQNYSTIVNKHISEYQAKMQGYQSESSVNVQQYQADINKQIQEFSQNADVLIKKFGTEGNLDVSKYSADVQKALGAYSAEISGEIQLYSSIINSRIQEYTVDKTLEIQRFNSSIAQDIQEFNSALQTQSQTFQALAKHYELAVANDQMTNSLALNNYQASLSVYQAEIQAVLQQAGLEIQKLSIDYQWLNNQLNILTNEYNSFFMTGVTQSNSSDSKENQDG